MDKKELRKRWNKGLLFMGEKGISRQEYLSMKGQLLISLIRERRKLPKVTKFSGYVKSHRDHGSLGEERIYPSEEFSPIVDRESILEHFITVGEFPF